MAERIISIDITHLVTAALAQEHPEPADPDEWSSAYRLQEEFTIVGPESAYRPDIRESVLQTAHT